MIKYNLVSENSESTVVTEYHPLIRTEITYQTEADLERAFIAQLQAQAYEYLPLKSENDLIANLRRQLELLNDYRFSDSEWDHFSTQNC
jgi:type I restriction enzyme R subunit